MLVTEGSYEFEIFYYPHHHDWDVSYCDFGDGHDGVYLSGSNIRFHHNWVDGIQDDAVYLSSPSPYFNRDIYIYQNLIRQCWMAFGGHARGGPGGKIYIFRNVSDLRKNVQFSRPTPKKPEGVIGPGPTAFMVHNSDHIIHMEHLYFYHNTSLVEMSHYIGNYNAGM